MYAVALSSEGTKALLPAELLTSRSNVSEAGAGNSAGRMLRLLRLRKEQRLLSRALPLLKPSGGYGPLEGSHCIQKESTFFLGAGLHSFSLRDPNCRFTLQRSAAVVRECSTLPGASRNLWHSAGRESWQATRSRTSAHPPSSGSLPREYAPALNAKQPSQSAATSAAIATARRGSPTPGPSLQQQLRSKEARRMQLANNQAEARAGYRNDNWQGRGSGDLVLLSASRKGPPATRLPRPMPRRDNDEIYFAKQLEQAKDPQGMFPEATWRARLKLMMRGAEREMVLRDKEQRRHAEGIQELAEEMGLHCMHYQDQRTLVISKDPLPHYRPDLDPKRPQRQLTIPEAARREVDQLVSKFRRMQLPARSVAGAPDVEEADLDGSGAEDPGSEVERRGGQERADQAAERRRQAKGEKLLAKQKAWQESEEGMRMLALRRKLPAFKEREFLLDAIANNQVLVVSGETGCGKTTQLPQFVLESEIAAGRGGSCNIICTQPRRISAISVAERVAAERGEDIGQSVGYQVRLEGKRNRDTRLLFCTTGILLRRLSRDPLLAGVSHVVVDEIHERGMNEDFLLIVLRDLLPKRPDMRLILMSATLNANLFSEYFKKAPMAHIPGFTHPVKAFFLEDVLERTGHILTPHNQIDDYGADKQWKRFRQLEALRRRKRNHLTGLAEDALASADYQQYSHTTQESLSYWTGDAIGFNLVEAVLAHIVRYEPPGAVLVFMTGWEDIHALLEKLRGHPVLGNGDKVMLLGCHGSMASHEQKLIFNPAPPGVRKIVLATNMAETSITINDCVYVVDLGKAKETSYDALNNVPCLLPSWISQASARQRRGRAGRVQPGVCFHLYPKAVHDALAEYTQPELLRTPLQSLCLQIKSLQLGGIAEFLAKALQPPEAKAVANAIDLLEDIGALDKDENLTALGRHLTSLPLEPRVGKMLITGALLRCLGPVLTVAAGLAERDPWLMPLERKEMADEKRLQFAGGDGSDHMALVRAYEGWSDASLEGNRAARDFCHDNFLSMQTLQAMSGLRRQFLKTLGESGLVDIDAGPASANQFSHDRNLVRAVILAGLWPGVASAVKRQRSTVFKTKEDGQVNLHPASVNMKDTRFQYPWLAYNEKVKTTSVFIRDSTGVSDTALLLFGGKLQQGEEPGYLHMQGGHLEFFMPPDAARTIVSLRQELDGLLQRKLADPTVDLYEEGKDVVDAVLALMQSDKGQGSFVYGRVPKKKKVAARTPAQLSTAVKRGAGSSPGQVTGPDVKTLLHNHCSRHNLGKPRFRVEETGPRNALLYRAWVSIGSSNPKRFEGARASSKRDAEKQAAQAAWDWISGGVEDRGKAGAASESGRQGRSPRRGQSPSQGGARQGPLGRGAAVGAPAGVRPKGGTGSGPRQGGGEEGRRGYEDEAGGRSLRRESGVGGSARGSTEGGGRRRSTSRKRAGNRVEEVEEEREWAQRTVGAASASSWHEGAAQGYRTDRYASTGSTPSTRSHLDRVEMGVTRSVFGSGAGLGKGRDGYQEEIQGAQWARQSMGRGYHTDVGLGLQSGRPDAAYGAQAFQGQSGAGIATEAHKGEEVYRYNSLPGSSGIDHGAVQSGLPMMAMGTMVWGNPYMGSVPGWMPYGIPR